MEWKSESSLWTRTILTRGSGISHGLNKLVTDLIDKDYDDNEQETSEMQFDNFALKSNATCFCKPIKGQSKTTKTYFCQLIHKNCTCWVKNLDRYWTIRLFAHRLFSVEETDQSSSSWSSTSRRRWCDWILENKGISSERSWTISTLVWLFCGSARWQEAEATRKCFNIVLTLQDKKFFISELFKVIQDAISLILHYRTMSWFRSISSSTLITLDVQSIYIPSSSQDWYWEVKIWAKDRQYCFCLWILWIKNTRILRRSTWRSTASCTVQAKSMEETSKHGVLGRHQTYSK